MIVMGIGWVNVVMAEKAFNSVLDELLLTRKISGDPGIIEEMTVEQRAILQAIKRSLKRIYG